MKPARIVSAVGAVLVLGVSPVAGQDPTDLSRATLEQLMDIRVTSAARKAQRAEDVAAAVYVITRDDIRRSGLTTLPEVLRLAPGVQVAHVSGSKWAISIRGFNDLFANKLLVLIDGRSVYTRAFGGVNWDAQDVLLGDVDRIEVIRGPGGAVWGANAVNGVINIITRPAAETQGLTFDVSGGTFERERIGVRYGGAVGGVSYRLFSQWSGYGNADTTAGRSADDRWQSLTAGFRTDWTRGSDAVSAQAHYTGGSKRPKLITLSSPDPATPASIDGVSDLDEFTAMARWIHTVKNGAALQVQAFNAMTFRDEAALNWNERTSDLDVQFETTAGRRHALVIGGGYRHIGLATESTFALSIASETGAIVNGFVQDEIALHRTATLTLGSKAEHDSEAGWGILPSARFMWRPGSGQRVWAAISRARRTPSATDRTLRINLMALDGPGIPILGGFVGNPDHQSQELIETEAGYRLRLGATAGVEVAVFRGVYDHLPTSEPLAPVFEATPAPAHLFAASRMDSLMSARTAGVEINANWSPLIAWRLNGSYSAFGFSPRLEAASQDLGAAQSDGHAPKHQWQVRSMASLAPRIQFDATLYHIGRLRELAVPAYTRVDARLEFKLTDRLSAIASGRNLLDERHQEFSGARSAYVASSIPRSALAQLRWQF